MKELLDKLGLLPKPSKAKPKKQKKGGK